MLRIQVIFVVFIIVVENLQAVLSTAANRQATRRDRCLLEYGHSCYGGHGKRFEPNFLRDQWQLKRPQVDRQFGNKVISERPYSVEEDADPSSQEYLLGLFIPR